MNQSCSVVPFSIEWRALCTDDWHQAGYRIMTPIFEGVLHMIAKEQIPEDASSLLKRSSITVA